jgi:hypothetical protein
MPKARIVKITAKNIAPGYMLDLEGDLYADAVCDNPMLGQVFVEVVAVEQETPTCVRIDFEGFDSIGFPPEYPLKVNTTYFTVGYHENDELPDRVPASEWFQHDDGQWSAVYAPFYEDDWFSSGDHPERQPDFDNGTSIYRRPIADVPTGEIEYVTAKGEYRERRYPK